MADTKATQLAGFAAIFNAAPFNARPLNAPGEPTTALPILLNRQLVAVLLPSDPAEPGLTIDPTRTQLLSQDLVAVLLPSDPAEPGLTIDPTRTRLTV